MNQQTQSRVSPMMTIIFRLLNKIEFIALFGTAVGFSMLYANLEGALEILNVTMSILAATFFIRGYEPLPVPEQKDEASKPGYLELQAGKIIPKAGWLGCAIMTVGILFRALSLNGYDQMLMIGCAALTAALVLVGIFIVSKPERSAGLMPLVYRAGPLWLLGGYLFMDKAA